MPDPGWREVDRLLGTVGGALGILPLVAIARSVATRLFPVPSLAGAERLARDVNAATYLETATLLLAVPAAAILFGKLLPEAAHVLGLTPRRASLAGAGFGTSLLMWRAGVSAGASIAVGVLVAAAILVVPATRNLRRLASILVASLFLAAVFAYYRPLAPVELFEDGLILFGASELAAGGRPYVDVYPIHGWGADGGLPAVLFRFVEHDLVAFQLLRAVLSAVALASLAAVSMLFFRNAAWSALGFAACLAFCPYPSERHAAALVAWCLLIRATRSDRLRDWTYAGLATAVALFVTLDFGVILLVAGLFAPTALEAACGRARAR
jgi:hypothetical protein